MNFNLDWDCLVIGLTVPEAKRQKLMVVTNIYNWFVKSEIKISLFVGYLSYLYRVCWWSIFAGCMCRVNLKVSILYFLQSTHTSFTLLNSTQSYRHSHQFPLAGERKHQSSNANQAKCTETAFPPNLNLLSVCRNGTATVP